MQSLPHKKIQLDFSSIKKVKVVFLVTFVTMIIFLGVFYLHPSNIHWTNKNDFSLINLLQFVIVDQFLIELITTAILMLCLIKYASLIKLKYTALSVQRLSMFFFRFIPFVLVVYFVTAPFSITIRYLYHSFILKKESTDYFDSYFFLKYDLYFAYLLPISISCVLLLLLVIYFSVKSQQVIQSKLNFKDVLVTVKTISGEKIISNKSILYAKKEGRKYFVTTQDQKYQITRTLSDLEKEFDRNFIRINRSTLINVAFFEEYSFWENEKYTLRMMDGENFTITRKRMKVLKQRIELNQSMQEHANHFENSLQS